MSIVDVQPCSTCKLDKPVSDFSRGGKRPNGTQHRCKACFKISNEAARAVNGPKYAADAARRFRATNPERAASHKRLYKYGLSEEDYSAMLANQAGQCAICQRHMSNPCVDHDHQTGRVRGLLCHHCNVGIGYMRDDPSILLAAIEYLRH